MKNVPSGGWRAGLSLAPHLSVASGFLNFGEVIFWGLLGVGVFRFRSKHGKFPPKIFGSVFYKPKFQSKQPTNQTKATKSHNHQLYQTQTNKRSTPWRHPILSPQKSLGQVEILDQHSVKGAERLRADEVVPNLDKAPPGRCRVAHGGCEMILIGMNHSYWYPSSECIICMVRLLLTIYLASGTLQQQFFRCVFLWV